MKLDGKLYTMVLPVYISTKENHENTMFWLGQIILHYEIKNDNHNV